jgi:phosphoglycerate dehydrogenase-like enzyme
LKYVLNLFVIGDDFTPFALFKEHLDAKLSAFEVAITGFDLSADSPTPQLTEVREFLGDPNTITGKVADAVAIITTFAPVTANVIDSAKKLKLIACGRGGPVNVNVEYATQKRIPVIYCPGRNAEAVADYTLGLILCLARNIIKADRYVRAGQWKTAREDTFEKPTGFELQGKTLGIVGFGAIGSRVYQRAKAFGLRMLIYDPFVKGTEEFVDLDKLLR